MSVQIRLGKAADLVIQIQALIKEHGTDIEIACISECVVTESSVANIAPILKTDPK